jgi:sialate O-acetylesterase
MGNWKFKLSDNLEWSKQVYDDSSWDNIVVPAAWETQGFRDYDGFGWYRKTFTLPAGFPVDDQVILVGRIDDMDQVFINGKLVGKTGNIEGRWAEDNEHERPRTYHIPNGLLKAGAQNTVAVRVFDQVGVGGIYEGPVTILPKDKYRDFWKDYRTEHYYNSDGWWSILKYWDWN